MRNRRVLTELTKGTGEHGGNAEYRRAHAEDAEARRKARGSWFEGIVQASYFVVV